MLQSNIETHVNLVIGNKPRFIQRLGKYDSFTISDALGSRSQVLHRATHPPLQGFIDAYYQKVAGMIEGAKVIECEMLLNEQDIQEYRDAVEIEPGRFAPGCSIPVWVEAFGAFFYVNKISNFGAKPLTKVELWKL